MPKYQTIFFDLDHTLWDFETNSRETLSELHACFELHELGISQREFIAVYEEANHKLWNQYTDGKIDRSVLRVLRWRRAFLQFGVRDEQLYKAFGRAYIDQCPQKSTLMPGVIDLLNWLKGSIPMCIITNGFSEVQALKLANSGIADYFDAVVTSEAAGVKKPHMRIFEAALKKMKAQAGTSLMVGDNQRADILGGHNSGLDTVHLDVHDAHAGETATLRVKSLKEVRPWLEGA